MGRSVPLARPVRGDAARLKPEQVFGETMVMTGVGRSVRFSRVWLPLRGPPAFFLAMESPWVALSVGLSRCQARIRPSSLEAMIPAVGLHGIRAGSAWDANGPTRLPPCVLFRTMSMSARERWLLCGVGSTEDGELTELIVTWAPAIWCDFPAVSVRRNQIWCSGKNGRSCSPN